METQQSGRTPLATMSGRVFDYDTLVNCSIVGLQSENVQTDDTLHNEQPIFYRIPFLNFFTLFNQLDNDICIQFWVA